MMFFYRKLFIQKSQREEPRTQKAYKGKPNRWEKKELEGVGMRLHSASGHPQHAIK